MTAQIHQGEMVIPAMHATAIRSAFGARGGFEDLSDSVGFGVSHPGGSEGGGGWHVPEFAGGGEQALSKSLSSLVDRLNHPVGGDRIGDTHQNFHVNAGHMGAEEIGRTLQKMARNFHPITRGKRR
jgi:hypothetical protein